MAHRCLRHSVLALLVIMGLAGSGCTILGRRYGEPIAEADLLFRQGATTVAEVVRELGPPVRMSALPGGFVMLYEFIDAQERQLGINLEFIGIDWFKIATGRGLADRQVLVLVFDDIGVLRAEDYRSWTEPVGKGLSLQFLFVALPTVDTRHLWGTSEQHFWGQGYLEPLPVTLNAGQSIVAGSHGLEMRGTPRSAGQRTLEGEDKTRRRRR